MKPIVNNDAWKKAFEIYKETSKYSPPEELNLDITEPCAPFTFRDVVACSLNGAIPARFSSVTMPKL